MKGIVIVSLKSLIRDAVDKKGITLTKAAPALHIPPRTLYYRLSHPDTFNIGELKIIVRALKIKPEDILRSIIGRDLEI